MRRFWILAIAVSLLTACDTTVAPTTTIPPLPPPDGVVVTTVTTATTSPTTVDPSPFTYRGVLPNGVDYVARIPGDKVEGVTLVTGAFSYMSVQGPVPVGEVRYTRIDGPGSYAYYSTGVLRLGSSSSWVVEVEFDTNVLAAMGNLVEETVTRSIFLETVQGLPVIRLATPFTWVEGSPEVRYEHFVVRSGCSEVALRCSENRVVQILSAADVYVGGGDLGKEQEHGVSIETSSTRSVSDSHYLDPGPLSERVSADLIWTGEEMIAWGGKQIRDGLTTLVDGAAFDPVTNRWRMLAPFPLEGPRATRAVWSDGEMIVISADGTFGYDPELDSWRVIGSGVVPSEWHDRMLYHEGKLYIWERSSLIGEFDVATGQWRLGSIAVPEPTSTYNYPFFGVLRAVDDHLVAIIVDRSLCPGRKAWEWSGDVWVELPLASLATDSTADCSAANQTAGAGGSLVIWDEEFHPAAAYSFATEEWRDLPSIPLGGTEGPSGPVAMDDDHFMVPRWGEGAIFDANTDSWTHVELPGSGTDAEIIWTGTEFLAWGIWETFDAWRWPPPEEVIP